MSHVAGVGSIDGSTERRGLLFERSRHLVGDVAIAGRRIDEAEFGGGGAHGRVAALEQRCPRDESFVLVRGGLGEPGVLTC